MYGGKQNRYSFVVKISKLALKNKSVASLVRSSSAAQSQVGETQLCLAEDMAERAPTRGLGTARLGARGEDTFGGNAGSQGALPVSPEAAHRR